MCEYSFPDTKLKFMEGFRDKHRMEVETKCWEAVWEGILNPRSMIWLAKLETTHACRDYWCYPKECIKNFACNCMTLLKNSLAGSFNLFLTFLIVSADILTVFVSFTVPNPPIWSLHTKQWGQGHQPSDLIVAIRTLIKHDNESSVQGQGKDLLFGIISTIGKELREDVSENSISTLYNDSMLIRMHELFIHQ